MTTQNKAATQADTAKADDIKTDETNTVQVDAEPAKSTKPETNTVTLPKAEAETIEVAKAPAKAKAANTKDIKAAQAEAAELKPWNGEPLTAVPETLEVTKAPAKAEAIKASKAAKNYRVKWMLYHDNKRYIEGDTLNLSDDDAAPLIEAGVLVAVK